MRVDLVHLVCLVHLISLVQPNRPNRPNKQERPAGPRASGATLCGAGGLFEHPAEGGPWRGYRLVRPGSGGGSRNTAKIVDVLNGKTKQDILTSASVPRRDSTLQGLTAMVFQEEADLVELSIPGAKSSGARSVPHSCRATVIIKDARVTDVRHASVPEWLGAENRCKKIFVRCSQ